MADISKITLPNGSSYNIKDAVARSELDGKAASSHTHDDRYYTESEINTKLNGKANTSHGNHVPATQTANNAVFLRNDNTWQTVTPANIGAAASSHTHDALYALKSKYGDTTINVGRKPDTTIGKYSTAEGYNTTASGNFSHAEGNNTTASGLGSHAEGSSTTASGNNSHSEGDKTTASGNYSHSEGCKTTASGLGSHAEGSNTNSSGSLLSARTVTISDVDYTITGSTAYGINSHAEGTQSFAKGYSSHAEGGSTTASGNYSHAEGYATTASGNYSHAEGYTTTASSIGSHAEGYQTTASGERSHAEGQGTKASFNFSHAEGSNTTASGVSSHAEGSGTTASGSASHAGGYNTTASGKHSFSHGDHTKSINNQEASFGKYNKSSSDTLFSVGDGTAENARHNAFEITTTGGKLHDKEIATTDMSLKANGGNADTVGGIQASDIRQITRNAIQTLPTPPIAECDYFVAKGDSTFPYYYGNLSIRYGSHTGEFVAIYQTTGDDKRIWYNVYRSGWAGWKEISTTPIKSTTFSETANETGSFTLWKSSENKVPIFIQLNNQGFYAIPFLYQNQWWLGSTIHEVTRQPVTHVTVSGTIYYIEI